MGILMLVYENWHGYVQPPTFSIFEKKSNFRKSPCQSFHVAFSSKVAEATVLT